MSTFPNLRLPIDKPVPMPVIRSVVQLIVEKFNPYKVILFGSYAYGNPKPWSDVDLLVVMDTPDGELETSLEISKTLPPRSFKIDILTRSQFDIDRRIALNDWFLAEVTTKGKVLFERSD